MKPIRIIPGTTFEVSTKLQLQDIQKLFYVCEYGLPKTIPEDMRDAAQTLICGCINPFRHLPEA